jgi:hypothetical protein
VGFEWVVGWALELGSHAEIVSPAEARFYRAVAIPNL